MFAVLLDAFLRLLQIWIPTSACLHRPKVIRGGSDFRWHRLPELPQGLRRHDASLAFAAGKGAADGAAYYFGGARGTVFCAGPQLGRPPTSH